MLEYDENLIKRAEELQKLCQEFITYTMSNSEKDISYNDAYQTWTFMIFAQIEKTLNQIRYGGVW